MSSAQRNECVQELEKTVIKNQKADGIRHTVLLVQIQCGGTGLNLQFMDRVIFTTPWWTAALMDQAAGRVMRIGQKNQVVIHTISLKEEEAASLNIDDFIQQRVSMKRDICTAMIEAAKNCMSVDEVLEEIDLDQRRDADKERNVKIAA
jgi:superfamily II DNA or RNA helicase